MSASRLASFTCIAITCNSSGRYGTRETNLENWLTRCAWKCVDFLVGRNRLEQPFDVREEVRLALGETVPARCAPIPAPALARFDRDNAGILRMRTGGTAREQSLGGRLLVFRIFLRREGDHLVGCPQSSISLSDEGRETRNGCI